MVSLGSMRESSVERRLHRQVIQAGGLTYKIAPTTKGLPDRLVILPGGRVRLVELKADGGRVSPAQRLIHDKLAARGVHVAVLTGTAEVDKWLTDQLKDMT